MYSIDKWQSFFFAILSRKYVHNIANINLSPLIGNHD